jgi:hypothetical protein
VNTRQEHLSEHKAGENARIKQCRAKRAQYQCERNLVLMLGCVGVGLFDASLSGWVINENHKMLLSGRHMMKCKK